MQLKKMALKDTNSFSETFIEYINNDVKLQPFYNRAPFKESFQHQIAEKKFSKTSRDSLVAQLKSQYQGVSIWTVTERNITALSHENTFTVTTGHQLNIFTGPLYFIYKIVIFKQFFRATENILKYL